MVCVNCVHHLIESQSAAEKGKKECDMGTHYGYAPSTLWLQYVLVSKSFSIQGQDGEGHKQFEPIQPCLTLNMNDFNAGIATEFHCISLSSLSQLVNS